MSLYRFTSPSLITHHVKSYDESCKKYYSRLVVALSILKNLFTSEFNQPGVSCATVSALVQVRFTFLSFRGKKYIKPVMFFLSFFLKSM